MFYVSFLLILYNSKFILMATSLGTNAVVVTRVHCTSDFPFENLFCMISDKTDNEISVLALCNNNTYIHFLYKIMKF